MSRPVTIRVQKVKKNRIRARLFFFLFLAVVLVLVSFFADQIVPYDPYGQNLSLSRQPPSAAHFMGTDQYGRDVFSRVVVGAQASVFSTLILVCITSVFGTLAGTLCGYFGGRIDSVLMRISDVCLAFPGLVFALAIAALLGGGISNAVIALAVISWPKYARVARGQTLALKNCDFLAAARLAGDNSVQMIWRHILPNILGPILVTEYDERREKHAADISLACAVSRRCDFPDCRDFQSVGGYGPRLHGSQKLRKSMICKHFI